MPGLSLCSVLRVRFTDTSLVEKVAIFVLCVPDFERMGILDLRTCGGQKPKLRLGKTGRRLLQDIVGGAQFLVLALQQLDPVLAGAAPTRALRRRAPPGCAIRKA